MVPRTTLGKGAIFITITVIVTAFPTMVFRPKERIGDLPPRIDSPVLAIELARNAKEIRTIIGNDVQALGISASTREASPDELKKIIQKEQTDFCKKLRWNTIFDFFFIASYTSMYYLLGRMWLGKKSWRLWIFLIAGVADVLENCVLLKTAQACYDYADTVVAYWTSNFSKTKWLFLGLNSSLVARLFWIWPKPGWQFTEALTACAYQVAGALLLSGLAYPDNIERGLPLLSLGVILQLTIFGAINRSLQNISLVKTDVY